MRHGHRNPHMPKTHSTKHTSQMSMPEIKKRFESRDYAIDNPKNDNTPTQRKPTPHTAHRC